MQDLITKYKNQVPKLFTHALTKSTSAQGRERDNSTSEMDKNELLDVYLYPSCVGLFSLPTNIGFLLFSLFFFLLFLFLSFL